MNWCALTHLQLIGVSIYVHISIFDQITLNASGRRTSLGDRCLLNQDNKTLALLRARWHEQHIGFKRVRKVQTRLTEAQRADPLYFRLVAAEIGAQQSKGSCGGIWKPHPSCVPHWPVHTYIMAFVHAYVRRLFFNSVWRGHEVALLELCGHIISPSSSMLSLINNTCSMQSHLRHRKWVMQASCNCVHDRVAREARPVRS